MLLLLVLLVLMVVLLLLVLVPVAFVFCCSPVVPGRPIPRADTFAACVLQHQEPRDDFSVLADSREACLAREIVCRILMQFMRKRCAAKDGPRNAVRVSFYARWRIALLLRSLTPPLLPVLCVLVPPDDCLDLPSQVVLAGIATSLIVDVEDLDFTDIVFHWGSEFFVEKEFDVGSVELSSARGMPRLCFNSSISIVLAPCRAYHHLHDR